ncbi:Alcohol dehydrogenase-like 4, partial [Capsicum annuum]
MGSKAFVVARAEIGEEHEGVEPTSTKILITRLKKNSMNDLKSIYTSGESSMTIDEIVSGYIKAAVCRKAGEPLIIEEIEVAPPSSWEVRIKIICTSLCQSDISLWKLSAGPLSAFPRILGHEAAGVVESVGENVEEVKEGDIVIPVFKRNCGECKDCKYQKGNACSKFSVEYPCGMPRDGSSRFKDKNGETLHHTLRVSSFSEYTVVDVTHIVKMSPNFPIDKASLLSCGVSTGLGAAWKVAEIEGGSTVAIFGLGAVAEGARLRGASKIIGVDLNPQKFEF